MSATTRASARDRLILALDGFRSTTELASTVKRFCPYFGVFKIGLQAYTRLGPEAVRAVKGEGGAIFLDLKLHDIPNTVQGAVAEAAELGVAMLTVHASGGLAMLQAALKAAPKDLLILGVTVLTSLDEAALRDEIGLSRGPRDQALLLAGLAERAGIGGIVASAHEISAIRAQSPRLRQVIPGIRPLWAAEGGAGRHDQRRVATPGEAIQAGADWLVIGRAVTDPPAGISKEEAAERVLGEVASI